jgi:hypothetical protein
MDGYWWLLAVAAVMILVWRLVVWARPDEVAQLAESSELPEDLTEAETPDGLADMREPPTLWEVSPAESAPLRPPGVDDDSDLWASTARSAGDEESTATRLDP